MGVKEGSRACCTESGIEKEEDYFHDETGLKFKKETSKLLCTVLKSRHFGKQIRMQSFEVWCWRRIKKISWTNRMKNEEALHRAKEKRNILHAVKRMKANWIGYSLSGNWLIKHIVEGSIEGRIEVRGRRGRRRKKLEEKRWYWNFKAEALDLTVWRSCYGGGLSQDKQRVRYILRCF